MRTRAALSKRSSLTTVVCTAAAAATIAVAIGGSAAAQTTCITAQMSVDSSGVGGDQRSERCDVSSNGTVVVFQSLAGNLVLNDSNLTEDVFVHTIITGQTDRVSVNTTGNSANGPSTGPSVSGDGRFVAFESLASDLVANDTNTAQDIFVRDLVMGTTERVSVGAAGAEANGSSAAPRISADGQFIVFESAATNLVANDVNTLKDVFVYDRVAKTTTRVSVSSLGVEANGESRAPAISGDGRYVVFHSSATNLIPNDTDLVVDVFLHDNQTGQTTRVNESSLGVDPNGLSINAAISEDGRTIAFQSIADNLIAGDNNHASDIFVVDRVTLLMTRDSVGPNGLEANGSSRNAQLSADGRFLAFESDAANLVAGDSGTTTDVFMRDRLIKTTYLKSYSSTGVQGNGPSIAASVSADARFVAFESTASNLVANDGNAASDVFVRDCVPPPAIYCTAKTNSHNCTTGIAYIGTPSASAGSGFLINAANELNNKNGLLFYSQHGAQAAPFQGGLLCVTPPLTRTSVLNSGGNPPPSVDCSGTYSRDFNVFIASGKDPTLVSGVRLWCQYWSRDPGFGPPNNTNLTDALTFEIEP
jgi:Tol biopolymer transport system component